MFFIYLFTLWTWTSFLCLSVFSSKITQLLGITFSLQLRPSVLVSFLMFLHCTPTFMISWERVSPVVLVPCSTKYSVLVRSSGLLQVSFEVLLHVPNTEGYRENENWTILRCNLIHPSRAWTLRPLNVLFQNRTCRHVHVDFGSFITPDYLPEPPGLSYLHSVLFLINPQ